MSDAAAPPTTSTDNRNALVIGVSSAFMAITVLFMALRVYIRGYILRAWGLDDSMFIWASVSAHESTESFRFTDSSHKDSSHCALRRGTMQ